VAECSPEGLFYVLLSQEEKRATTAMEVDYDGEMEVVLPLGKSGYDLFALYVEYIRY